MKKWMLLILTLLLFVPAMAETSEAIPVEIVDHALSTITLETAIMKARAEMPVQPEQYQTRAELVRMSDGSCRWIVTVFDLKTLVDGWCVEIDAASGNAAGSYTTDDGYFLDIQEKWAAAMGKSNVKALWRMEEKALYDALYALTPAYGLPQAGDMSAEEAINRATVALAPYYPDALTGYLVSCGYFMGGEGCNGVWEICLLQDGKVICQVNLDAVTGEIYYMEPADNGNG